MENEADGEADGKAEGEADGSQEILRFCVEHIESEYVDGAPVSSSLKSIFFPLMLHPKGTAGVDNFISKSDPKRFPAS